MHLPESFPLAPALPNLDPELWFAVQTRARNEKAVARRLREMGVTTFLPLVRETRRWSDRRKTVELPLFSCYVFVKFPPNDQHRFRLLMVDGVQRFVGSGGHGIPIPAQEIEAVRRLVTEHASYSCCPFIKIGQRVRVRGGALDGMEGILVSRSGEDTLVISVDAIQRSIGVRIQGYDVERV